VDVVGVSDHSVNVFEHLRKALHTSSFYISSCSKRRSSQWKGFELSPDYAHRSRLDNITFFLPYRTHKNSKSGPPVIFGHHLLSYTFPKSTYMFLAIRICMYLHPSNKIFQISNPVYLSAIKYRILMDICRSVHYLLLHSDHWLVHYRFLQMLFLKLCNKAFFVEPTINLCVNMFLLRKIFIVKIKNQSTNL
jgi:hypothetical protein